MSARSLLVAALLTVAAAPAGAQEYVWNADRPDGVAPLGVFGDRTLAEGQLELTALYTKDDKLGIRFGSNFVDPLTVFDSHELVPIELYESGYLFRLAYGVSDNLTLAGRVGFVMRDRRQLTDDLVFFDMDSEGVTDVEVQALYDLYEDGPYRAHLQLGAIIPTGTVTADGGFGDLRVEGRLPYDMQLGAGAFGISPGVTAQMMNEFGSVGAQISATLFFLEKEDWRAGDRAEAQAWAAYRFNRFFSASVRMHAVGPQAIEGSDPELDPDRDPGEFPYVGRRPPFSSPAARLARDA